MDLGHSFYFVSTRSSPGTLCTINTGQFSFGVIRNVAIVPNVSKLKQDRVNFDLEISPDCKTIYFVDGIFH